jgi:hypothetical protein
MEKRTNGKQGVIKAKRHRTPKDEMTVKLFGLFA